MARRISIPNVVASWILPDPVPRAGTGPQVDFRPPFPLPNARLAAVSAPSTRVNQGPRLVQTWIPAPAAIANLRAPYPGEFVAGPAHNPAVPLGLEADSVLAFS